MIRDAVQVHQARLILQPGAVLPSAIDHLFESCREKVSVYVATSVAALQGQSASRCLVRFVRTWGGSRGFVTRLNVLQLSGAVLACAAQIAAQACVVLFIVAGKSNFVWILPSTQWVLCRLGGSELHCGTHQ